MTTPGKKRTIVLTVTSDLVHDQRMIRICNSLTMCGYNVSLIGRVTRRSPPLKPMNFKQERINCVFQSGPLFYMAFTIRLFFKLFFTRADILVACDLDTIIPNRFVATLRKKILVFDSHEYFTEVPELQGRRLVKWCWELAGRLSVPKASACYTVSGLLAEELGGKYNKPFQVIRNLPVTSPEPVTASKPVTPVLIYQGNLNPGRGLEECILALNHTNVRFTIAGDGPIKESLEKLVESRGLNQRVIFTGKVPPELLNKLTRDSGIGINILDRHSRSYYLSLANKFFNYIHCGVPQVCSDFPEYRNINNRWEVAVLCDNNPVAIAEAVNRLINDPDLYLRLRQNCIEAAKYLSWQAEEKKLLEIFNGL